MCSFLPYLEHQLDKAPVESRRCVGRLHVRFLESANAGHEREKISSPIGPNNAVPRNWAEFLRINETKTELFAYLSKEIVTISTDKQVIYTLDRDVICRQPMDKEGPTPCSHEEADSRIMGAIAQKRATAD